MGENEQKHDVMPDADVIELDHILIDDEFNCRGNILKMDVVELARDIEEKGLTQPVTLMRHNDLEREKTGKEFCLIAGFRRTMCYEVMEWPRVPCVIKPWMSKTQRKIINLLENVQREDLNIMQEARALKHLHDMGVTRDAVATELKKSHKWVQVRFYLLDLPEQIQAEAQAGLLNQAQIMELRSIGQGLTPEKAAKIQFETVRAIKDAKAKGEKAPRIKDLKKITKGAKKHRTRAQVLDRMIELNDLGITFGFWSRCLSWAAGEITDVDFFQSVHDHAEEVGDNFTIPHKYHPD